MRTRHGNGNGSGDADHTETVTETDMGERKRNAGNQALIIYRRLSAAFFAW